jgi:hypothetical protein
VTEPDPTAREWRFRRFGLLVTGHGEADFLPNFLRLLTTSGDCTFKVIRRVGQRSPQTSKSERQRMTGTDRAIPTKDETDIGLPAHTFLKGNKNSYVVLVDDLEHDRREQHQEVFARYRRALDAVLPGNLRHRAAVHFLVNMIEAYYLADAAAINAVLGTSLFDYDGDVEEIRHPKQELKRLQAGFDEKAHGRAIVACLDLEKVLADPRTCASLRTLIKWCWRARREPYSDRFQLLTGVCSPVTRHQIDDLDASWPSAV